MTAVFSGEPTASARMRRLSSIAVGAASLILLGLNIPDAVGQWADFSPVWSIVSIASMFVPGVALLVLSRRAALQTLRLVGGALAIWMLACLLCAPLALVVPLPPGNHLWLTDCAVIAGASAAVAFRTRYGWIFLALLLATIFALAFTVTSEPRLGDPLESSLLATFYLSLIVALAIATRRAGDQLDLVRTRAVAEATEAAVTEARRLERGRIESLVHDSVIVALLTYARQGDDDAAAAEARKALRDIEQFESAETATARDPQTFLWELQSLTTEASADIRFSYKLTGGLEVPSDVASAVIAATSEALRNSLRHAGDSEVAREVHTEITDSGVAVTVLDAGDGFDPETVSRSRLGISTGIVGRMARVNGGTSIVSSIRGRGTTIAIRWERP